MLEAAVFPLPLLSAAALVFSSAFSVVWPAEKIPPKAEAAVGTDTGGVPPPKIPVPCPNANGWIEAVSALLTPPSVVPLFRFFRTSINPLSSAAEAPSFGSSAPLASLSAFRLPLEPVVVVPVAAPDANKEGAPGWTAATLAIKAKPLAGADAPAAVLKLGVAGADSGAFAVKPPKSGAGMVVTEGGVLAGFSFSAARGLLAKKGVTILANYQQTDSTQPATMISRH